MSADPTEELICRIGELTARPQQPVPWSPDAWRELLGDEPVRWAGMPSLDVPESLVSREQVKDLAREVLAMDGAQRAHGLRALFLWSQIWGYGDRGYGPTRVSRILAGSARRSPGLDALSALVKGYRILLEEGGVEAYRRMSWELWIPGLGPAFLTKFLYFAGYESLRAASAGGASPLILDAVVTRALDRYFGFRLPSGWSTQGYSEYLDFMEHTAALPAYSTTPEHLEMALFELGRSSGRA